QHMRHRPIDHTGSTSGSRPSPPHPPTAAPPPSPTSVTPSQPPANNPRSPPPPTPPPRLCCCPLTRPRTPRRFRSTSSASPPAGGAPRRPRPRTSTAPPAPTSRRRTRKRAGGTDAPRPPRAAARRRQRPGSAPVEFGDAEGQVQGLATVEARVARGLVPVGEVVLGDAVTAADALGDVVTGELDVDAPGVGAQRPVHLEEPGDLREDVLHVPRLAAVGCLDRVPVHGIADPGHLRAARRHLLHDRGQGGADA